MSAVDKQGRFSARYVKSELGDLLFPTTLTPTARATSTYMLALLLVSSEFYLITLNPLRSGSTFRDHQVVIFT